MNKKKILLTIKILRNIMEKEHLSLQDPIPKKETQKIIKEKKKKLQGSRLTSLVAKKYKLSQNIKTAPKLNKQSFIE